MKTTTKLLSFVFLCAAALRGQSVDINEIAKHVTVKTLKNGLTVLIYERPVAPVFSFFTQVDTGSAQDIDGQTGLAHMMEHEAFKGTPSIGTKDWTKERVALEKIERSYVDYRAELDKRVGRDETKLKQLEKTWMDAREAADAFVEPNEFSKILDQNGEVGMNAFTSEDETGYFYSLPANRVELWAYMESERFLHPVFREFYKERDVVMEERRMRTDSNPIGRLVEQLLASSYIANPYHRLPIGWMSDLQHISATEGAAFFRKYYVPSNMVLAIVGDVKAAPTMAIVEKYFGRLPAAPKPDMTVTTEPPQTAERRVVMRERSQPIFLEGYHRPDYRDPDDNVYDVLSDILSRGRTSRLYRALVRDQKIALQAQGFGGFPGVKYPQLFAFFAVSAPGHTPKEQEDAIHKEIDRLKNENVSDDELKSVKTRAKADLVRSLGDNSGLAQNLALYQTRYGDWRELFRQVDKIDKVTKADLRRVANKVFVASNRTVGVIETETPPAGPRQPAPPAKGGQQ